MDNIIKFKEENHLIKQNIDNKELYYCDLNFIDSSFTGRADAMISNTFIFEAKNLIINAIKLFELGYFDCSYYSLREAIEISTIMIYLADLPIEKRDIEISNWKNIKNFPMREQMIKKLSKDGNVFKNFKINMFDYFEYSSKFISGINKYVHKQGADKLYVNSIILKSKYMEEMKRDFIKYLEFVIGYVAVMRLAIDPFPILLMDEDIYFKTEDIITEAYAEDFILKYINPKFIEQYKNTEIYKGYENYFNNKEKMNEVISNIIKENYVDIYKIEQIMEQFYLLRPYEKIVTELFCISDKLVYIYVDGSPIGYFSNTPSKKKSYYYSSQEFNELSKKANEFNMDYENIYRSVVKISNYEFFIEHNEKLVEEEIMKILNLKI